jgi:hypothetical protein
MIGFSTVKHKTDSLLNLNPENYHRLLIWFVEEICTDITF